MRKTSHIHQQMINIHSFFLPSASIITDMKYLSLKKEKLFNDVIYTVTNIKDFSP
jgi:hypothetical protein